jgi:hypothetical protein
MPDLEEKEVSMTTSAAEPEKTRKRRVRRNKTQRSVDKTDIKGEAIVKTEEVIMTQKPYEKPKGIKVETQQAFKLVPKKVASVASTASALSVASVASVAPPAPAPVLAKTKITIMPKTKKVQKITIIGKPVKKTPVPVLPAVKQKILLSSSKKTRKFYKERRLRIEL